MPFPVTPDELPDEEPYDDGRDEPDDPEDDECGDDATDWQDVEDDPRLCCLGDACLNPHPNHTASECFDREMAEAWDRGES